MIKEKIIVSKICLLRYCSALFNNMSPICVLAKICPSFYCIEITSNFYIKAPVFCEVFFAPKMARLNNGNCEI